MRCSQIVKHFTLAVLIAFAGIMLTGCGEDEAAKAGAAAPQEDSNIKVVKDTVFPADKSRTLGEALSANFDNLKWKAYKNDNNQQIVEFTGTWKHGTITHTETYRGLVYLTQYFVNRGNTVTTQFLVNKDQTVEFVSATVQSDKNDLGEQRAGFEERQPLGNGIEITGGDVFFNKVLLHK